MEVFDFEDEHLVAVLPNDRRDSEEDHQDSRGLSSSHQSIHAFLSPTEEERISQRDTSAIERRWEATHCQESLSQGCADVAAAAAVGVTKSSTIHSKISVETDQSSERYQHLPAYARDTFVDGDEAMKKVDSDPLLPVEGLPATILVPSDARLHAILRKTAETAIQSPQLEVLIKVKQADNPDLVFLHHLNEYNDYYEWWKEKLRAEEQCRKARSEHGNGHDLFGVYSSSSDDDEEEVDESRGVDKLMGPKASDSESLQLGASKRACIAEPDEDVKARRLERAMMLKEHFQSKMK